MSDSKQKQMVRPEVNVRVVGEHAQAESGISRRLGGLVSIYATTAAMPDATKLPDGIIAIDEQVNKLKYTKNGAWVALN